MPGFRRIDAKGALALDLILSICNAASVEPHVGDIQVGDPQTASGDILHGVLVRLWSKNIFLFLLSCLTLWHAYDIFRTTMREWPARFLVKVARNEDRN